jgi:hypothetical protein
MPVRFPIAGPGDTRDGGGPRARSLNVRRSGFGPDILGMCPWSEGSYWGYRGADRARTLNIELRTLNLEHKGRWKIEV